jgi:phosphoadenosine phosphosulfate reductase
METGEARAERWDHSKLEFLRLESQKLESAAPQEVLEWALRHYPGKLTMATAFGAEGCALIAMLGRLREETGLELDIFNLDTGYQFQQTLDLRERMQKKYGIPIRFVRAPETVKEMEARLGGPIYKTRPDECCSIRKVAPLAGAVEGFDAWISAIRRDQTPERAAQPIVGPDPRYPLVKINPLANWSKAQVWEFIRANDVPYNPLHDIGFPSIGCYPCTKPVKEGEDDRAGRWAGTQKRECGLHLAR